ncbi:MAG TPA: hypothetical protein VMX33_06645 [bacterium]|nr:hypothetical protein [bacterium]
MNPYIISGIVVLAVLSTVSYFFGTRKNRWVVSTMSNQLESVLKPRSTNYVNIGGVIGYNFSYALVAPYTNAKGTITLSPRHSLLYLPFSRLLGIGDRFFVNVFTKKKLREEAHIVDATYMRKANIEGVDSMKRRDIEVKGKKFVMLWRSLDLSQELEATLSSLEDPSSLRHFCAYPETGTFFIHLRPKSGQIENSVKALAAHFSDFMEKEKEKN